MVKKTGDEAFAYPAPQIEAAGVFVLLLGNLGSYHSNIPLEFFQRFCRAPILWRP